MIIDLLDLNQKREQQINLKLSYDFQNELENTEIIKIKDFNLNGVIKLSSLGGYDIDASCRGIMVLESSLTLNEVDHEFSFNLEGSINEMMTEINKNIKNVENSIDIFPIIWENILMEIPIKVCGEGEALSKTEGDGWKLITDDEQIVTNPELEKLKQLL